MNIIEFLTSYKRNVDEEKLFSTLKEYKSNLTIDVIDFDEMDKWNISDTGDIFHESGKFFCIRGGESKNIETGICEYQPIIDQPEQGILGFVSRIKEGRIEILGQAKIEPGNLQIVQYSPTVQATKSNYSRVHNGKRVIYIEKFIEESDGIEKVIFANKMVSRGFQSEHGYKFYKKANDNVHVYDNDTKIVDGRFVWLSLSDVRSLMSREHCANMDMRSVLATIDFIGRSLSYNEIFTKVDTELTQLENELLFSSLSEENSLCTFDEIHSWLTLKKDNKKINQQMIPLKTLYENDWIISDKTLSNKNNKNFELVAVKVSANSREVSSWYQPIVVDNIPKVYAFLLKKINGIFHVLIQSVEESFSWNGPELGPSFHSINSETLSLEKELSLFGVDKEQFTVIYDCFQSEEGGRFMEQKNRYMLLLLDDIEININDDYKWITLYQLKKMTKHECSVNIEARTLLTAASYYKDML